MKKAIEVKHPTEDRHIIVCESCVNEHEIVGNVVLKTNEPSTVKCAQCNEEAYKVTYG